MTMIVVLAVAAWLTFDLAIFLALVFWPLTPRPVAEVIQINHRVSGGRAHLRVC
jgi:hypothetical protein